MKTASIRNIACTLGLIAASYVHPALAAESQLAVVLAVHGEEATRSYAADHHLQDGKIDGGRFAVVKLVQGAWGDASYALVYVPKKVTVAAHDLVELASAEGNALTKPGSAVVTRRVN
jgi:hypothetical protein